MVKRVCIDPGHGGDDPGAIGFGTEEEDVALDVGMKLMGALGRCGVSVKITRTRDTRPSLARRCEISNDFAADRFVSCHFDASASPTAKGMSLLYVSPAGKALAGAIYDRINNLTPWTDRGLKFRDDLYVLKGTNAPAVIVEGDFLTNSEAHALIKKAAWRTVLAETIAKGVCKDLGVDYKAPVVAAPAPVVAPPPAPPAPAPVWKIASQTADTITLKKG